MCLNVSRRGVAIAIVLALVFGSAICAATEEIKIGGTGAALGTMRLLADEFTARNPDIRVTTVPGLGSGGGIKAVAAGAIGLAVTSRQMNESERQLGAVGIEYACSPFVFAVSAKSKVTAITSGKWPTFTQGKWWRGRMARRCASCCGRGAISTPTWSGT